uniref:Putative secreted protein n=1 Tax=Panstrongylus lignarius TaxID=156445 RepID=A0A224XYD1_9HEMI
MKKKFYGIWAILLYHQAIRKVLQTPVLRNIWDQDHRLNLISSLLQIPVVVHYETISSMLILEQSSHF